LTGPLTSNPKLNCGWGTILIHAATRVGKFSYNGSGPGSRSARRWCTAGWLPFGGQRCEASIKRKRRGKKKGKNFWGKTPPKDNENNNKG